MSTIPSNDSWKLWIQIANKAKQDAVFKDRLLANLESVVKEHGLEVPPDLDISLNPQLELSFRRKPPSGELTDEDLDKVVGGSTRCNRPENGIMHCVTVKISNDGTRIEETSIDIPQSTPRPMPAW